MITIEDWQIWKCNDRSYIRGSVEGRAVVTEHLTGFSPKDRLCQTDVAIYKLGKMNEEFRKWFESEEILQTCT